MPWRQDKRRVATPTRREAAAARPCPRADRVWPATTTRRRSCSRLRADSRASACQHRSWSPGRPVTSAAGLHRAEPRLHPTGRARLRLRDDLRGLHVLRHHHRVPPDVASSAQGRRTKEPDRPGDALQEPARPAQHHRRPDDVKLLLTAAITCIMPGVVRGVALGERPVSLPARARPCVGGRPGPPGGALPSRRSVRIATAAPAAGRAR